LLHLPAIAACAGIVLDWEDFDRLSKAVPLITRVYPNGSADVNGFEAAGGMPFVIRELVSAGLLHGDLLTVAGDSLADYGRKPVIEGDALAWVDPGPSGDETILRGAAAPFAPEGGFRILTGNLGRACIKVSAVEQDRWTIEAPARVFHDQASVQAAFQAGELDRDVVVVVRFQGPRANGMPELHKLTPPLGVLQNRGFRVALVTDGRMSGASGKVPCAIHCSPEALGEGPLSRVRDGDVIRLDAVTGELFARVDPAEWAARTPVSMPSEIDGMGRELFGLFRQNANEAERGASPLLTGMGW
jgi:phosphogluconate dehydratase